MTKSIFDLRGQVHLKPLIVNDKKGGKLTGNSRLNSFFFLNQTLFKLKESRSVIKNESKYLDI